MLESAPDDQKKAAGRVISLNHAPMKRPSFDTRNNRSPQFGLSGRSLGGAIWLNRPRSLALHGLDRRAPYLHRLVRARGVHYQVAISSFEV
jgi:hypothetical protein